MHSEKCKDSELARLNTDKKKKMSEEICLFSRYFVTLQIRRTM